MQANVEGAERSQAAPSRSKRNAEDQKRKEDIEELMYYQKHQHQ